MRSGHFLPLYYAFKALASPIEVEQSWEKSEKRENTDQDGYAGTAPENFFEVNLDK